MTKTNRLTGLKVTMLALAVGAALPFSMAAHAAAQANAGVGTKAAPVKVAPNCGNGCRSFPTPGTSNAPVMVAPNCGNGCRSYPTPGANDARSLA